LFPDVVGVENDGIDPILIPEVATVIRLRLIGSAIFIFTLVALATGQDPKKDPPKTDPKTEPKKDPPKVDKVETKQDGKKFELKFEKDKKFYQSSQTTVQQLIKVMGQDLTQSQDSTFYYRWTPIKQEGDKWELTDEVEGIKMSIDISGNKINYDSTLPDGGPTAGNPGLMDFFKKLVNSKFTVTLDKNYKVEKVDGVQDFIKNLSSGNQSTRMDEVLKGIMTDDAVKQMCDPTFNLIPDGPKKAGDKWSKPTTLNLGPIGSYTVTYNFTYVGVDKDMDKIEVEPTLVYSAPKADPTSSGLLFRIKEGKLTSVDPVKGVILYNPKLQRIESADITIKLKGELTVNIGMTDTKVELLQTQVTKIATSDTSFLTSPKK
jgi:hypothetical protein